MNEQRWHVHRRADPRRFRFDWQRPYRRALLGEITVHLEVTETVEPRGEVREAPARPRPQPTTLWEPGQGRKRGTR